MALMNDYRTILVGTDGSELAEPTVARAAWLAAHDDADLVVVCVYSALTRRQEAKSVATLGDSRVGTVLGRDAAREAMHEALAVAGEAKATVTAALLVEGEPAEALLQIAGEREADLVVLGARRDVSLAERLLGTVVGEVVRRAGCEVLVVRPPAASRTSLADELPAAAQVNGPGPDA